MMNKCAKIKLTNISKKADKECKNKVHTKMKMSELREQHFNVIEGHVQLQS